MVPWGEREREKSRIAVWGRKGEERGRDAERVRRAAGGVVMVQDENRASEGERKREGGREGGREREPRIVAGSVRRNGSEMNRASEGCQGPVCAAQMRLKSIKEQRACWVTRGGLIRRRSPFSQSCWSSEVTHISETLTLPREPQGMCLLGHTMQL